MILLLACGGPPEPPAAPAAEPSPCAIASAPSKGPLAAQRQATRDPLTLARLYIEEARTTGDAGYYTLAELALDCADTATPATPATPAAGTASPGALRAHLGIQFHRFAEVEAQLTAISADAPWLEHALLGDARMEQGNLDGAAEAYQRAVDLRPGLELYDRIGWLRWLEGDMEGAVEMAALAVSAGSGRDPEPYAWVLTRLGWLHALQGLPSPELDLALRQIPDYPPARLARGRVRLHEGHVGAAADLYAVGATVEATWARSEVDPTASVETTRTQDPRGYAMWLTPHDPAAAVTLLDAEWKVRQDATTRMARAYARWRAAANDPANAATARAQASAEARTALATGILEPRVLQMGAFILDDRALAARALAMGPGLLPSERAALAALAAPAR